MATVLQHQIAGRVNDLNQKMMAHARIIFQLSVELDKMKSENEELKKILRGHKIAIKQLKSDFTGLPSSTDKDETMSLGEDITMTKNDLKKGYENYQQSGNLVETNETQEIFGENNASVTLNMLK